MMAVLTLLLSCDRDPCSWAHGDWSQTGVSFDGKDVPLGGIEAQMVVAPNAFGYRADGAPSLGPAILSPMTETCSSLRIEVDDRTFVLSPSETGVSLDNGPRRRFHFQSADR